MSVSCGANCRRFNEDGGASRRPAVWPGVPRPGARRAGCPAVGTTAGGGRRLSSSRSLGNGVDDFHEGSGSHQAWMRRREGAILDGSDVRFEGAADAAGLSMKLRTNLGFCPDSGPACRASPAPGRPCLVRTDADGWRSGCNVHRSVRRAKGRHHLQHQHGGTGILQGGLVLLHPVGGWSPRPCNPVTAQGMHGLWCQPKMGTQVCRVPRGSAPPRWSSPAFELDHVGTGLHEHTGAAGWPAFDPGSRRREVANEPGGAFARGANRGPRCGW